MDIKVIRKNEVHLQIYCDKGIAMELNDHFSFLVPNYKFMPKFKSGIWDGKLRLFSLKTYQLYVGLQDRLIEFAQKNNYTIEFDKEIPDFEFSEFEAEEFIKTLNIPEKYKIRDYQMKLFLHSVRKRRSTNVSPTSSGKSFIIYLLSRFYNRKTLIIVPTINLVAQMSKDFADYGYIKECHQITAGVQKLTDHLITISTWQSIYKMPKSWFDQFKVIIVDEVHGAKANSLVNIMEKLDNCKHRFGFTGTMDDQQTSEHVITGLFGPVKQYITTRQLIDQKHAANFEIKSIVLNYDDDARTTVSTMKYPEEIEYIISHNKRNIFLRNLCLSLKGNTILFFRFVEKHGEILYNLIKDKAENRNVYYISGKIDGEVREKIRELVEKETNAIIVASIGTSSTGLNIINLKNIIFSYPSKSKIKTMQSIGRSLRRSETKVNAVLYDIADDLSSKTRYNYSLIHFKERVKMYQKEQFPMKKYQVSI